MDRTPEQLIDQAGKALARGEWLQSIACSNLAAAKLTGVASKQCGQLRSWMTTRQEFACILLSGHPGDHKDIEGDTWN